MANIQKSGLRTGTLPWIPRPLTYCSSDQDLGWLKTSHKSFYSGSYFQLNALHFVHKVLCSCGLSF